MLELQDDEVGIVYSHSRTWKGRLRRRSPAAHGLERRIFLWINVKIYILHSHLKLRPADAVRCAHGSLWLLPKNEHPHFPVTVPVAAFGVKPTGRIPG
jgi:hypothetical protein